MEAPTDLRCDRLAAAVDELVWHTATLLPACASGYARSRSGIGNSQRAHSVRATPLLTARSTGTGRSQVQVRLGSGTDLDLVEDAAGAVVRDVLDGCRPDEPVARLVAAHGGCRDRAYDALDLVVRDDEHEQRLRQGPRLEHTAPVLVR